jgi:hypothetical protein
MIRLYKYDIWFPQANKHISPRLILMVLSNRVKYQNLVDQSIKELSPSSFRRWIRKWDSKI